MDFPPLPHLGLTPARVDFSHARKLDMYQHLSDGAWTYEPDVLAVLLCLLGRHERARFINVGANIGYFPIIVSKLFGGRVEVHAYEPMPKLLDRLRRAQRKNSIDFRISNAALSDFEGTAPFHLSARSDTSNSLNPNFRPSKEVIDVPVTTLDQEFRVPRRRNPLRRGEPVPERPTVLLIDTESTEPAVLRGGRAFIARVRPAIICEVLAGRTEDELSAIFRELEYDAYALTDDGPERRAEVVGDRSYEHRDWVFLPHEHDAPSLDCYAATLAAIAAG